MKLSLTRLIKFDTSIMSSIEARIYEVIAVSMFVVGIALLISAY